MKNQLMFGIMRVAAFAALLAFAQRSHAAPLVNFPFDEGSGSVVTDVASGLTGNFGVQQDPSIDLLQLIDASPSGMAGDRSLTNSGEAFLLVDDSVDPVLNITNQPLTIESWVFIDPFSPAAAAEGIVAYGGSYKMGLRSGYQVFTLFGIVDITNNAAGPIGAGGWVHLAAAWEPAVGVYFYVNGVEYFEPNTSAAARTPTHNYLSIGSEGFGNNIVAALDRVRVHNALLGAEELDSDAANPKPLTSNTLIAYDFNEASLPSLSSTTPARPTISSFTFLPAITSPVWTNDTPSGLPNDFALAFLTENPPIREFITVRYDTAVIDLGVNNTNYTLQAWVKLPTGPFNERRVIYRTDGPGPRISLSINSDRTLHTTVLGTADFTTGVTVPNDARWHHIAVVMEDFARLHFYLDGILRQTVNRTQANPPTSAGTAGLTIGKESETRYFRGVLDRVLIHNEALALAALDYPAVPGLPTFDVIESHPAGSVADAGSSVNFTAAPASSSAATYQWRYRTNLADQASVALPGETSTVLTLSNIGPQHEGFYFLVVSNAVGVAESYAAELRLTPDLSAKLFGFEAPDYTSGPIENQDEWTNNQNGEAVRVLTASQIAGVLEATGRTPGVTVHSGTQALLVSGAGAATTTIRQITGLEAENNLVLDVWVRPLGPGSTGAPIGNTFFTLENSSGVRAAAFRLGPANSIDFGTSVEGVWQSTGELWDENTWYRLTMRLDYAARTYDFLINGVQVNSSPIAFYNAGSESFRQIRIFRGSNQSGMILDDLNVTTPDAAPVLGIRRTAEGIAVYWPANSGDYILEAANSLSSPSWTTVPHNAVGEENVASQPAVDEARFYRLRRN